MLQTNSNRFFTMGILRMNIDNGKHIKCVCVWRQCHSVRFENLTFRTWLWGYWIWYVGYRYVLVNSNPRCVGRDRKQKSKCCQSIKHAIHSLCSSSRTKQNALSSLMMSVWYMRSVHLCEKFANWWFNAMRGRERIVARSK